MLRLKIGEKLRALPAAWFADLEGTLHLLSSDIDQLAKLAGYEPVGGIDLHVERSTLDPEYALVDLIVEAAEGIPYGRKQIGAVIVQAPTSAASAYVTHQWNDRKLRSFGDVVRGFVLGWEACYVDLVRPGQGAIL